MSVLDDDPVARGYRRVRRTARNLLIIALVMILVAVFCGVPHVQWEYRYYGSKSGITSENKTDADYWNPLIGWHMVDADQYAAGCPMIVFIPLRDCFDLEPYRNPFTTFILPDGFFGAAHESSR